MDELLKKLQKYELSILDRLVQIFKEFDISYWIAYGTVLGAVRHKGFIPWDDDIDIYIDGNDYSKLIHIFLDRNNDINGLSLHDFKTIADYPFTFPKIIDNKTKLIEKRYSHTTYCCGVYIDIFPLYNVPDNPIFRRIDYFKKYLNYCIVESHHCSLGLIKNPFKKMCTRILGLMSKEKAQLRLFKMYTRGISKKSSHLSEPLIFKDSQIHFYNFFNGFEELLFENNLYCGPKDVKEYLKNMYGDFMTLPPEDKRRSIHDFVKVEFYDK